ncbi:hypothetical protein TSAR_000813 [Trichomalopsis sarcophagae]|uniref:Uncharacterized protein n=1 Tax=Trichomalopsis sarcophagae TaxID=543379 RepID=A0A232FLD5_9HYME|nr:hypothetical protein TSAR_000813 [Trichomalopsis sarcophagae]
MVGMSELKKPRRANLRVSGNRLEPGVQLALVSEAIQTEIDKIPNKPWPEFDDSFVKMRSIVVVASNAFSRD